MEALTTVYYLNLVALVAKFIFVFWALWITTMLIFKD